MSLNFHCVGSVPEADIMMRLCILFVQLQVLHLVIYIVLVTDHLASPVPVNDASTSPIVIKSHDLHAF